MKDSELDPDGHLRGLLFEIARNKALDHIKHQKIADQYLAEAKRQRSEELYINLVMPEEDEQSFQRILNESLDILPPKGRQIFELNRNEGLTYAEILEYLNISVKTVETHMRRVLQKLRDNLEKYALLFIIGNAAVWGLNQFFS